MLKQVSANSLPDVTINGRFGIRSSNNFAVAQSGIFDRMLYLSLLCDRNSAVAVAIARHHRIKKSLRLMQ
ncbi:MAG: hypothetical protein ABI262_09610 [Microcoleus sp.]